MKIRNKCDDIRVWFGDRFQLLMIGLGLFGFAIFALFQMQFMRDLIIDISNRIVGKSLNFAYWNLFLIRLSLPFFALGSAFVLTILWIKYKSKILSLTAPNNSHLLIEISKFVTVVFMAVAIRLFMMTLGHNYDFESFQIVGKIVSGGGNVYSETSRYNYGPIFSLFQGLLYHISSFFENQDSIYRLFIVCFLSCFDIALSFLLYRRYRNMGLAALFLLNPISIIITGYHNQFDNIAVLFGYMGCLLVDYENESLTKKDIASVMLLSLSLTTKHLLFVFPFWILINVNLPKTKRIVYAIVPVFLFLLSFAPYLHNGYEGIFKNVFAYRSFNNFPLIHIFIKSFHLEKWYTLCFTCLMLLLGYCTRKMRFDDQILFYFLGLVCFSSAMTNQYLAIPVISICVLGGIFKHVYFTYVGFLLIFNQAGLQLGFLYKNTLMVMFFVNNGYLIADWILLAILLYRLLNSIQHDASSNPGF